MSNYPEHVKLALVIDEVESITKFIEWMSNRGLSFYNTDGFDSYGLLTDLDGTIKEYFNINQLILDKERRAMLSEIKKEYEARDGNEGK